MSGAPLPRGWTCGDCAHLWPKCSWLSGAQSVDTECEWDPPRFVPAEAPPTWISDPSKETP